MASQEYRCFLILIEESYSIWETGKRFRNMCRAYFEN